MKFNPDDPKWTAYVLGELGDTERAELEKELESSAAAREAVDEIRMTTMLLKDEFTKDELAREAPAGLLADQRRMIRTAATPKKSWGLRQFAFAAAAACLMLAMIAAPWLIRSQQGNAPVGAVEVAGDAGDRRTPEVSSPVPSSVQSPQTNSAMPGFLGQSGDVAVSSAPSAGTKQSGKAENDRANALPTGNFYLSVDDGTSALSSAPIPSQVQTQAGAAKGADSAAVRRQGQMLGFSLPAGGPALVSGVVGGLRSNKEVNPPAAPPPPTGPPSPARILLDRTNRPAFNTEAYDQITDNPFLRVSQEPLATFSIDVDTASYANMRRFLGQNQLPPKDSVRIEEMINYFSYDYAPPTGTHPIAVYTEIAAAPWKPDHRLVRIGIKGREINAANRPSSNLVFLIDVSGSMNSPEKLPLLKAGMNLLVDKLTENDRVAIVVYAGASGVVLRSTTGDKKQQIHDAVEQLGAGGSTNGAAGIQMAYDTAVSNFIRGGINRVILATDGDFNVGITNQGDLLRLIEEKAKSNVFLSVLGFGMGNYKDSTLEKLADKGNGNYAYVDTINEARKVLVEEAGSTLMTIAKDVKIQIEFNPAQVNAYRLIGYENRVLRNEDFNDDRKDAGDMGAGHVVTALFEVVPSGVDMPSPSVDALRYQQPPQPAQANRAGNRELLNLKVRYKEPEGTESKLLEVPVQDRGTAFSSATGDYRFAAAVASFGMILRDSPHKGQATLDTVIDMAEKSKGLDKAGYREEFVRLVRKARALRELQ